MLTKNSLGMEFIWWVGVVEDRHDPMYLGRCKVRCLGFHTEDKNLIPTQDLPWATPLMPITSASQTNVGQAPVGPVEGTWVVGFFRDGRDAQEPIMFGTLNGVPEVDARSIYTAKIGFHDAREYDEAMSSTEHPFGKSAFKKKIRSLKDNASVKQINLVPREPDEVISSLGASPIITEQERKSPYPDISYIGQPTTPALARGKADPTTGLTASDDGKIFESKYSILARKRQSRSLNQNIKTGGDFGSILKQQQSIDTSGFGTSLSAQNFLEPSIKPSIRSFSEPISPYNASYPYNHVTVTESGHVIEMDDTPNFERLHFYHRSGSFQEYHPSGTVVNKTTNELYNIIHNNSYDRVAGHKIETVDKSYQILVNRNKSQSDSNMTLKVGSGGSFFANIEQGNYFVDVTGKYEANVSSFMMGTRDETNISADKDLNFHSVASTRFSSSALTSFTSGTFDVLAADQVNFAGTNKGIKLHSTSGTIDIGTGGIPFLPAGGVKMHTELGPIEINAATASRGISGFLNMTLGDLGEFGRIAITPVATILNHPVAMTITSGGAMSISSTAPIKIGSSIKSLKSCFDDLIDEIAKITVPTGSGNSGTPINASQLQLLKTKIMTCII